jgi:hypothetical protein
MPKYSHANRDMSSLIDQQAKLFKSLTKTTCQGLDFESFCEAILRNMCQAIDWDYGEIWIVQKDSSILNLGSNWYLTPSIQAAGRCLSWQQFRACSQNFTLHLGEGLPGRVCSSQQPEWVPDVSMQSEGYFLRNQIAKAFSVKAGLGFPVLIGQQIRAALVLFKATPCQENLEIMQWLQAVMQHIDKLSAELEF